MAEAFAVQGGREVRVVVQEGEVDDLGAVELSVTHRPGHLATR